MKIDWWTLGFQTINVLVLVWLLGRFFWRPVAGMIAQRRAAAKELLDQAEASRAEAAASLAEIARTRAGFAQERDAIIKAAAEDADRLRAQQLDQAAKEADALKAAAILATEQARISAEKSWSAQATRLAVDIAARLAARLDGASVQDAFLDWLIIEIGKLPDSAREAAALPDATLEAVSATALSPAAQERARARIATAFGAHPHIRFRVDPALIQGLELHGPDIIIANSWHADLARILADITNDDRT